jgi:hypothetical protein
MANLNKQPFRRQDDVVSLTDNSGGTASNTLAAITDVATANAVASLAAKVEEILDALRAEGTLGK